MFSFSATLRGIATETKKMLEGQNLREETGEAAAQLPMRPVERPRKEDAKPGRQQKRLHASQPRYT